MDNSRNKYFYCFRRIGRTGQLSAIKLSKRSYFPLEKTKTFLRLVKMVRCREFRWQDCWQSISAPGEAGICSRTVGRVRIVFSPRMSQSLDGKTVGSLYPLQEKMESVAESFGRVESSFLSKNMWLTGCWFLISSYLQPGYFRAGVAVRSCLIIAYISTYLLP